MISGDLLEHLKVSLCWMRFHHQYGGSPLCVSLKNFGANIMVDATTRTLFGNKILGIEPELVQSLQDFNNDA